LSARSSLIGGCSILGFTSEFAHSTSSHRGEEFSEGEAETAVYLMTAQEIKMMGDEDIICFYKNLPPFKAKRMNWLNFPILEQRLTMPPPPVYPIPAIKAIEPQRKMQPLTPFINPDLTQ
jgi:type IV secretory pathway TraG/TraD family ATPase VirD4